MIHCLAPITYAVMDIEYPMYVDIDMMSTSSWEIGRTRVAMLLHKYDVSAIWLTLISHRQKHIAPQRSFHVELDSKNQKMRELACWPNAFCCTDQAQWPSKSSLGIPMISFPFWAHHSN